MLEQAIFIKIFGYVIFVIYVIGLSYITIFCLLQFHLLIKYKFKNKDIQIPKNKDFLPVVTIQLPIFNERYVIERLIDKICALDYPKEKMEIQVLDDSNDVTVDIVAKKVEEYKAQGFDISQIRREKRTGFKAGALKYATEFAKGDFIAIFDADFLPEKDFLLNTIPHFENEKIGVVQTRWGHINQKYSILTELQAFQLNVHFTVEQKGRYAGNFLLQFNGTAGVWRKQAIADAGGWEADTLTEDLDLSYRTQLKGWEILFLEDVLAPAELPAEMHGLKSQQFRWMKGGAETARKMLPTIWGSKLGIGEKIHATSHLLGSSVFLFIFIIGIFSVPLIFMKIPLNLDDSFTTYFIVSLIAIIIIYFVANVQIAWEKEAKLKMILKFIVLFPLFLSLSMGLSLHNSIAVIQGFMGRKSAFIRTPKFNITSLKDNVGKKAEYRSSSIGMVTIFEGLLFFYFAAAVFLSFRTGHTSMVLYHSMLAIGFGSIFYLSVKHRYIENK